MAIRIALLTAALFASAAGHGTGGMMAKAEFDDALDILEETISDINDEDRSVVRELTANDNETDPTATTTTTEAPTTTAANASDDTQVVKQLTFGVNSEAEACAAASDDGRQGLINHINATSGDGVTDITLDTVEPRDSGNAITCGSRRLKGRSLTDSAYSVFVAVTITYADAAAASAGATALETALADTTTFATDLAAAFTAAGVTVTVQNLAVVTGGATTTTAGPTGGATTTAGGVGPVTTTATLPSGQLDSWARHQASVSTGLCALAAAVFLVKL